jgi:stage II sporulation protein D
MKYLFYIPVGLLVLCLSTSALANPNAIEESFLNPIYRGDISTNPAFRIRPSVTIDQVRIKVFPHDGPYPIPQGEESIVSRAFARSDGTCTLVKHIAAAPLAKRTYLPRVVIKLAVLDFLTTTGTLTCTKPITLVRETGLAAYTYHGVFHIGSHKSKGRNALYVVNEVDFETYIKGVVPSEMPASWATEALRAQSIAARTYGAQQILAGRAEPSILEHPHWDIDDTVWYQAYKGKTGQHPSADRAVDDTAGQFMLYDGQPIIAYFSADSGGHTEESVNVWGNQLPYTPAKPEVYDLNRIDSAWKVEMTLVRMNELLQKRNIVPKNFVVTRMEVKEWTSSGRMKQVQFTSTRGTNLLVEGEQARYGLALKSARLELRPVGNHSYAFAGTGFGHGVGMNQWGAKALVEQFGWTAKQILEFYYEGARLSF